MTQTLMERTAGLPSAAEWHTMLEMADIMIQSGFLPDVIKTPQAAVAIIQKGRELGVPPSYALSNIAVIKGRPTCSAELMLALIYRDHGDDAISFSESSTERATVTYRRRGWSERQSFSFTMADAQTAMLTGKDSWKQYPSAMLRARCVSAVARMVFPDSIGGMYTPEELGAAVTMVDDEIRVINAQSVDVATGEVVRDSDRPAWLPTLTDAIAAVESATDEVMLKAICAPWRPIVASRWGDASVPLIEAIKARVEVFKAAERMQTLLTEVVP